MIAAIDARRRTEEEGPQMIAVGYVRRSKESGPRTVSLEDQRVRITEYCQTQGWPLVEIVTDDGVSGGRRERLDRLTERVRVTGARVIVVYHLDRFARDLAATLDYLRQFSRRGVELHVVGRGRIEADSATGFIVTAVEGLAAEHYRRVISEKTRDALARLRAQGRRISRWAPYGFRLGPEGRLRPDLREQGTLTLIAALRASGQSLRGISGALVHRGIFARNGRPFAPMTLSRVVTNRSVSDKTGSRSALGHTMMLPKSFEVKASTS